MKGNDSNTWLKQDLLQLNTYLNSADIILVERNRTHKILMDLFRYHFKNSRNLNILDMGCGDGILTKRISEKFPDNKYYLIDGSSKMIEKAKENIPGDNIYFHQQTFEEYIDTTEGEIKYDFVHSANAIHHLDIEGKEELYTKIYREMKYGGLFINIDPIQPSSEQSEYWQFRMWIDWMNEALYGNGLEKDVGKYDHIPKTYKMKEENKPNTLFEQLEILTKIGFKDVDCFYKYGVFALFGGTK